MSILEQMTQTLLPLHLYALSPGSSVLAELSAYAQSLEKAAQRLERLTQAAFIQTAPSQRLAVWERVLGLHQEDAPLSERRAGILARLSLGPRASRGMRFVHFWKRSVLQALSKRMFQRIPSACCSQAMQAL